MMTSVWEVTERKILKSLDCGRWVKLILTSLECGFGEMVNAKSNKLDHNGRKKPKTGCLKLRSTLSYFSKEFHRSSSRLVPKKLLIDREHK